MSNQTRAEAPICADTGTPKWPGDCWNVRCQLGKTCCRAAGAAIPRPSHSWRDFGQLAGKNVSWCSRCDALAFTGQEPNGPCGVLACPDTFNDQQEKAR